MPLARYLLTFVAVFRDRPWLPTSASSCLFRLPLPLAIGLLGGAKRCMFAMIALNLVGEARLTLAQSRETYDIIVLDAFSSDVIPVHLLTREAIEGYLAHLGPRGALVLPISNRYLELANVVAAIAAEEGLASDGKIDVRPDSIPWDYRTNAQVAVLARSPNALRGFRHLPGWAPLTFNPAMAAWTDDYSNILGALPRKQFGH